MGERIFASNGLGFAAFKGHCLMYKNYWYISFIICIPLYWQRVKRGSNYKRLQNRHYIFSVCVCVHALIKPHVNVQEFYSCLIKDNGGQSTLDLPYQLDYSVKNALQIPLLSNLWGEVIEVSVSFKWALLSTQIFLLIQRAQKLQSNLIECTIVPPTVYNEMLKHISHLLSNTCYKDTLFTTLSAFYTH